MAKTYFGKGTMLNGLGIVGGLGLGALLKQVSSPMVNNTYYNKFYGILSIIAGVTLGLKVRKPIMKSVGTGMVAYGILDVLVSNIEGLQKFLPAIASPTGFTSISSSPAGTVQGGMSYGRSMMGASINSRGSLEVVGGNYDSTMRPEVIGDDFDVSDMMDMDF